MCQFVRDDRREPVRWQGLEEREAEVEVTPAAEEAEEAGALAEGGGGVGDDGDPVGLGDSGGRRGSVDQLPQVGGPGPVHGDAGRPPVPGVQGSPGRVPERADRGDAQRHDGPEREGAGQQRQDGPEDGQRRGQLQARDDQESGQRGDRFRRRRCTLAQAALLMPIRRWATKTRGRTARNRFAHVRWVIRPAWLTSIRHFR
ncbi:hypothetical protein GCM10025331_05360 [Actinoplanes utahensis]